MIVKNEAHVILRCLKSVVGLIDSYLIVDTGSTDKTKEVIEEFFSNYNIPGQVVNRPWVDFSFNRNEAIELARGRADYLLVVDADDEIIGPKPTHIEADCLSILVHEAGGLIYERCHIFRSSMQFYYKGVLHEYLDCKEPFKGAKYPLLRYIRHTDGARWLDQAKFFKDAIVLEKAIKDEPNNSRYAFYLAQSWRDAGVPEKAIACYQKHFSMENCWEEERWFSLYQIAHIMRENNFLEDEVVQAYLRAFEFRPTRIEPMHDLGRYLQERSRNRHVLCYHLLMPLLGTEVPNDTLFIDIPKYNWALKDVVAISAYYVGDHQLSRQLNDELLTEGKLPDSEVERVRNNLSFSGNSSIEHKSVTNHVQTNDYFGDFFSKLKQNLQPGGSEFGLGLTLFNLVISTRAKSVIEIGRFKGFSTLALASAMKFLVEESWEEPEVNRRENIDYETFEQIGGVRLVYSIDSNPTIEAKDLIQSNGLSKYVKFMDIRSTYFQNDILLNRPDIVFIDGDPSFDKYMEDVKKFVPMLKNGGYFILNNFKVIDTIISQVPQLEHMVVDTGYKSFVMFRKLVGLTDKGTRGVGPLGPGAKLSLGGDSDV